VGAVPSTIRLNITGRLYDASTSPPTPLTGKTIHIRYELNGDDIATATTDEGGNFSVEVEIDAGTTELYVVFTGSKALAKSYAIIYLSEAGGGEEVAY